MLAFGIALVITFAIGMPIAFAMLGSSIIYLAFVKNASLIILPQKLLNGLDSFPLLAIPFFLLAGELMSKIGMTQRLVDFSTSLVGHIRGGLAHVVVVANMIMAGMSGSAVADASATGALLIPTMKKAGYDKGFAAALTAAASTIGPIVPPSISMVVYGSMANVSIGRLFLGGAVPGILMGLYLMGVSHYMARKWGYGVQGKFSLALMARRFKESILALVMPVIVLGGIIGGVFTPTEASVVAVAYALFIGMFVYRNLTLCAFVDCLDSTIHTLAGVMIVISAAHAFGWILTAERFGVMISNLLMSLTVSRWVVLLAINLILLILGCFVEVLALLIILSPMLVPVVQHLKMDPVHFGVMVVLNLMIGLITPPVGLCMYVGSKIAEVSIESFARRVVPFIVALVLVLLMVTFIPDLVLFLPNLMMPVR